MTGSAAASPERPKRVDCAIEARWVVPVEPDGQTLADHTVVVDAGVIVDVVDQPTARRRYDAAQWVSLPHQVLLPGFVNAHTHAAMTLLRGKADDLPLMVWLREHIWPAEAAWISPQFVRDGTALAIAEMLRAGVTCYSDMYFFPEVSARLAQAAGMRVVAGMIVFDQPNAYSSGADDCLAKGLRMHDEFAGSKLVTTAFAPHAPYTVSDGPWREIAELAGRLDVPVHTHLHETEHEVSESLGATGMRPIERLNALGVVNSRLIAAHMTQVSPQDQRLLAQSGATVVHCPESNLKLASGFCPVHDLHVAGINVALGTDGAASNNDADMLAELRLAALLGKGVSANAAAVPARQALRMATLHGARALGLSDRIGSIEVGKQADLVAISLDALSSQPIYDPVSQVVYTASRDQVTDVWVAGRRQVANRELTGWDVEELSANARSWHARISS